MEAERVKGVVSRAISRGRVEKAVLTLQLWDGHLLSRPSLSMFSEHMGCALSDP